MSKIDWKEDLAGTFKAHAKHIIIAHGSDSQRWPEEVTTNKKCYAAVLDAAISNAASNLPVKVRMSMSDAPTLDEHGHPAAEKEDVDDDEFGCDLILFPDQIRIHYVRKSQIPEFVQHLAAYSKQQIAAKRAPTDADAASASSAATFPMPHAAFPGTSFLICSHKLRDKRCGITGPILAAEIDKTISLSYPAEPTPEPVHTFQISHIGGHKVRIRARTSRHRGGLAVAFASSRLLPAELQLTCPLCLHTHASLLLLQYAGNVIVYPPGVWYGRVLPCHVPHLMVTARCASLRTPPDTRRTCRAALMLTLCSASCISLPLFLQLAHCKDFAYLDPDSGSHVSIHSGTDLEAELKKLKPLIRGRVDAN